MVHETPSGLSSTLMPLVPVQAQAGHVRNFCLKEGMILVLTEEMDHEAAGAGSHP